MTYVQPIPFDWNAFVGGFAPILDLAAGLPIGTATGTLGLGGVAQQADSSFYFPQNDGSADPGTQNTLAKITFDLFNVVNVGRDEKRKGYDETVQIDGDTYRTPAGQQLGGVIYSIVGNRLATVTIKCECWDLTGVGAPQYLERVRINLRLPSFMAALRKLNVAINKMTALHTMNYLDDDQRAVSAAAFDLLLNTADAANDEPVTTIETVKRPRFIPIN